MKPRTLRELRKDNVIRPLSTHEVDKVFHTCDELATALRAFVQHAEMRLQLAPEKVEADEVERIRVAKDALDPLDW